MPRLYEMTKILRSKQAGPFEVTFDIMFKDEESYRRAMHSEVIDEELIASLYHIKPEDVRVLVWFDAGLALKVTIPRQRPSGSPGETDLYAAQQHVPLESIEIP